MHREPRRADGHEVREEEEADPAHLSALEDLVSGHLTALDLQISGRLIDSDPTVQVVDPAQQPPRLLAVITDHRTDRVSLRLQAYVFQDFAYQPADQTLLVGSFCKIVAGYLRGEGTYGTTRPLFGFLGKTQQTCSINTDGDLFSSTEGADARPLRSV